MFNLLLIHNLMHHLPIRLTSLAFPRMSNEYEPKANFEFGGHVFTPAGIDTNNIN